MTPKPASPPPPDLRGIPALEWLTDLPRWVCWSWRWVRDRWTKPPFHPNGQNAAVDNPATWCSYLEAKGEVDAGRADGVGIMLDGLEWFTAIDLDGVRDPVTGVVKPWAARLVEAANTYTEITPSGAGLRLLGTTQEIESIHRRGAHPEGGWFELFCNCKRYITVSGQPCLVAELADDTGHARGLEALLGQVIPPQSRPNGEHQTDTFDRSAEFMRALRTLKAQGHSLGQATAAFAAAADKYRGRLDTELSRAWDKLASLEPPDERWPEEEAPTSEPNTELAAYLSGTAWLKRKPAPPDRLLGDFITTTTRAFIVGRTGLGKTLLGLACATGIALGSGFLHWQSSRPARVLYVDGEMPLDLLTERIHAEAQRARKLDNINNLMVFSLEEAEAIAQRWPMLGMFEALNTEPGHDFIKRICKALQPDVIIFDNVQSLIAGVQKEEETWIPVLPLVQWLTRQRIGQLWFDHTGHNTERQYGTAVKAWRFDVVGLLLPLSEDERQPEETSFRLTFDHPGKARRRTPANWDQFASHIIRLKDGLWTGEESASVGTSGARKLSPAEAIGIRSLRIALDKAGTLLPKGTDYPPGTFAVQSSVWRAEFYHLNGGTAEGNKKAFQRSVERLIANTLITQRDDLVWLV